MVKSKTRAGVGDGMTLENMPSDINLKDVENPKTANTRQGDDDSSAGSSLQRSRQFFWTSLITALIVILGAATCATFMGVGISNAKAAETNQFDRRAQDLVNQIARAWEDYVTAASWIHGRCRSRAFSRADFRETYEYLIQSGLDFQAAQFDPNITHEERPAAEQEAREFYAEFYPHINYRGLVGFNYADSTSLEPRNNASVYFPIHYMEPVLGNEPAIDLDYYASGSRKATAQFCLDEGKPALTDRLTLVQETTASAFGVVLMHPGYKTTTNDLYNTTTDDVWPRDLASIVIRIPDLLRRAAADQGDSSAVYIYDATNPDDTPLFLGGVEVVATDGGNGPAQLTFQPELDLEEVRNLDALYFEQTVDAANKEWIVSVHSLEGTYTPEITFVVLGGVIIFFASVCLASWVFTNTKRVEKFNRLRSSAESERAALILDNARQATETERELNDFIAHEVRNPVAAAMAACNFVKVELHKAKPMPDQEALDQAKEDVNIIDNALRFVNDLLRNMLDMHRAANKQLQVTMAPVELLHDILEPVAGMLYRRGSKVKVIVECPGNIFVMADSLRLKQIVLNLGRNSAKFIDEGFIRLRAVLLNGHVKIYVDDSGCGIPKEKRKNLFHKFQESLDALSQGTGIGLFLCKNLVELMGGEIYLDEGYDSGIEGHPGTRFVVDLKAGPIDPPQAPHHENNKSLEQIGGTSEQTHRTDDDMNSLPAELPNTLSVLFIDDDRVLRKLFTRAIKNVCPRWTIREAANGETALQLVEEGAKFDVIFIDMYMASVEKQLLGTEAVSALRNLGFTNRICGLSANDKEQEFYDAGADSFVLKPFPCDEYAMTQQLYRVLYQDRNTNFENVGLIDEF